MKNRVAIIGFGEVGGIFAADLSAAGVKNIFVFDIDRTAEERVRPQTGIIFERTAHAAVKQADVVIIAVTAAATLDAIRSIQDGIDHAPLVVDVTSVSPSTREEADRLVSAGGGRYVESVIMTSVPPKGIRSPMLLGGPHAAALVNAVDGLDMQLTCFASQIGQASAVKMCRSVMIKGLEALMMESMLAARRYGVEQTVLTSLGDTLPHADWTALAGYLISRSLLHGRRRAEEVREVAQTVSDVGVEAIMSRAIVSRQQWAYDVGRYIPPDTIRAADLVQMLDAMTACGV